MYASRIGRVEEGFRTARDTAIDETRWMRMDYNEFNEMQLRTLDLMLLRFFHASMVYFPFWAELT